MPVIVEKDGQQRQMGDPQYKRLKGQGKLNGYSLVKSVPYNKPGSGAAQAATPDKVTLPEEVTKFQQKTVAEREQDALNKAYVSMGEKGKLFEVPEDYNGDPSLLKISPLPSAAPASPAADAGKAEQPAAEKAAAPASQASAGNAGKASPADQKTGAGAKASPAANQSKKSS